MQPLHVFIGSLLLNAHVQKAAFQGGKSKAAPKRLTKKGEEERRREEKRGKERRRRRTKESSRQDRRGPSHRGRHSPPCHNASGNTAHAAHAADAADAAALFREAAPRLQIRPLCAGLGSLSQRSTLQLSQSSQSAKERGRTEPGLKRK